jgi:hypothetical protein
MGLYCGSKMTTTTIVVVVVGDALTLVNAVGDGRERSGFGSLECQETISRSDTMDRK